MMTDRPGCLILSSWPACRRVTQIADIFPSFMLCRSSKLRSGCSHVSLQYDSGCDGANQIKSAQNAVPWGRDVDSTDFRFSSQAIEKQSKIRSRFQNLGLKSRHSSILE